MLFLSYFWAKSFLFFNYKGWEVCIWFKRQCNSNYTLTLTQKLPMQCTTCISPIESQKGVTTDIPLRTRRALLLYKVYGDSALLVLNWSLKSINALLALGIQYEHVQGTRCIWKRTMQSCVCVMSSNVTLHHKTNKSCMAQFCVMARNRWSGSAWVIFRFWDILKEQFFFYIILKFGSIKRIISRVFCCFSRPIFLRSDGSCDHSTCPIISL